MPAPVRRRPACKRAARLRRSRTNLHLHAPPPAALDFASSPRTQTRGRRHATDMALQPARTDSQAPSTAADHFSRESCIQVEAPVQ